VLRDEKGRRYRCAGFRRKRCIIGAKRHHSPGVRIGNRVIVAAAVRQTDPYRTIALSEVFQRDSSEHSTSLNVALSHIPFEADKKGKTFREQRDSIVDETMAPEDSVQSRAGEQVNENEVPLRNCCFSAWDLSPSECVPR